MRKSMSGITVGPDRPRHGRWRVALLSASFCVGIMSTAAFAPMAFAAQVSKHVSESSASAYCAKMPASKVSSVVGSSVTLDDALVQGSTLVCLYNGSAGAITIEKETGMAASGIATRQKAEAGHKKLFYASQPKPLPKGTTISFSPLAGFGPSAFYWTGVIGGKPYSGADAFKGNTGFFSEMGGALQSAKLDQLERLALAA